VYICIFYEDDGYFPWTCGLMNDHISHLLCQYCIITADVSLKNRATIALNWQLPRMCVEWLWVFKDDVSTKVVSAHSMSLYICSVEKFSFPRFVFVDLITTMILCEEDSKLRSASLCNYSRLRVIYCPLIPDILYNKLFRALSFILMTDKASYSYKVVELWFCVLQDKAVPLTGLVRPWGFQEVQAPRISRQSAHEGGKVVSPTHRPPLPPVIIPGTHFS
jgi:hypothetical protein